MGYYYCDENDRCPECGEIIETEIDPFASFGEGRYKAYCGCTAKMEQILADRAKGSRKDLEYRQPTIGDILEQQMKGE